MWFVIVLAALVVIAAGLILRRRASVRRTGPAFNELSREDQVQVMRHLEDGAMRHGEHEGAKYYGAGRFGETAGPGF